MKIFKLVMFAFLLPMFTYAQTDYVGDWKMEYVDANGVTQSVQLSIASDGAYSVDFGMDSNIDVKGKYEFDGGEMTVWDTEGEYACVGEDKKGIYQVTASAGSLTMTRISDECENRGGAEGIMTFQRIGS